MRKLLIGLLALGSVSTFAQSFLEVTGFRVINNTSIQQVLYFQDSLEFKISKERFLNQNSAIQFCKDQNSELDTEFNSLLIAMSGALNASNFLKGSITFKINDISGIWQWSEKKDSVSLMVDGHGTSTDEVPVSELNKVIRVSLPAICVKHLK